MKYYTNLLMFISEIESFDHRLDLLTQIEIATNDPDLFKACEQIRNEIVPCDDMFIEKALL